MLLKVGAILMQEVIKIIMAKTLSKCIHLLKNSIKKFPNAA